MRSPPSAFRAEGVLVDHCVFALAEQSPAMADVRAFRQRAGFSDNDRRGAEAVV
jgi:hypothetical protein